MTANGSKIVLQEICPGDPSGHLALAFDPVITQLILNALDPRSAEPVRC